MLLERNEGERNVAVPSRGLETQSRLKESPRFGFSLCARNSLTKPGNDRYRGDGLAVERSLSRKSSRYVDIRFDGSIRESEATWQMPITVCCSPSSVIDLPTRFVSPPYCPCQSRLLMRTTGALPPMSSDSAISRPSCGRTPKVVRRFAVILMRSRSSYATRTAEKRSTFTRKR